MSESKYNGGESPRRPIIVTKSSESVSSESGGTPYGGYSESSENEPIKKPTIQELDKKIAELQRQRDELKKRQNKR